MVAGPSSYDHEEASVLQHSDPAAPIAWHLGLASVLKSSSASIF